MSKTCYIDCYAGAAGDMLIGAILGAIEDKEAFIKELNKLSIKNEFDIKITDIVKKGIASIKFDVILKETHDHHHRGLLHIQEIINNSDISTKAKELSLQIFQNLAEAEAKVHGTCIDKVHFHEVGAIDSIVDIVGFSVLFTMFEIDEVIVSPVNLGSGIIECAHGYIPIPAPATAELIKKFNIPNTTKIEIKSETLTPTGAAILGTVVTKFGTIPEFDNIESISYGAGTKDFDNVSNTVRVIIGKKKL